MPSSENGNRNTMGDGRSHAAVPVVATTDNEPQPRHVSAASRPSVKDALGAAKSAAITGKSPAVTAKNPMAKKAFTNVMREKDHRKRMARRLLLFVCFVGVFCLGFLARGYEPLMARLDPASAESDAIKQATTATTYNSVSARVSEVEKILNTSSMDTYDVDRVSSAVLQSFSYSVGDSYLRYFDEERYQLYTKENAATDYAGIGVLFAEYDGKTYAADVFQNSVADLAGVHQGDIVLAVNGDASQKWTPAEVINAISSSEGGDIVITWQRSSTAENEANTSYSTTLKCQVYRETNVKASLEDNNVGLISVTQLSSNSSSLVGQAVTQLQSQGAKSFVLDLRDCSGGFLSQAVNISSLFVKSGTLVQIKTKDGITNKIASGSIATELPLVVLINENTAGTAEVLAAALRDNDRAMLVGVKTVGKGSVQIVSKLSFGGALRYTAAYYLSPLGHDIDGQGISPDTSVSNGADQLSVAKQIAQSRAAS